MAHDEDGEYILRFLRNDKQFETFTVKGQKRYSHEWYFTAQKNDVFKVEIEVVKSFWPSIYAHANLDWLEVQN